MSAAGHLSNLRTSARTTPDYFRASLRNMISAGAISAWTGESHWQLETVAANPTHIPASGHNAECICLVRDNRRDGFPKQMPTEIGVPRDNKGHRSIDREG